MILTPLQKYKKDLRKACQSANISDWFERYLNKARGLGNTNALIHTCDMQGATLIVAKQIQADDIAEQHKSKRIKTTYVMDPNFATRPTRSVVDNAAILLLLREGQKIQMLAEQLLTLMDQKGID